MDRRCPATKRDGERCSGSVPDGETYCWAHQEKNKSKLRSGGRKGGKSSNQSKKLARELHALLANLTQRVIDGDLEPYRASVAAQLTNVRIRLMSVELQAHEIAEVEEKLKSVESALGVSGGRGWGR